MPSGLRKALDELPTSMDNTYEQTLERIPKEKRQHAHRLFQCLVAAFRPLRVEELAEIFAIEFDPEAGPHLSEGWRPENPEEAVLSTCSTLVTIVDDWGSTYRYSRIVQFSHYSVKEFLTSGRLLTSEMGGIRNYHIHLNDSHTILVRACLSVLLQLDEKVNKKRLATFPLAFYAAEHWVDHAKFEDVASRVQGAMERLFDPKKPYLTAWTWIHDVEGHWPRMPIDIHPVHPPPPDATALYYAASCGFSALAKYLIVTHGEGVTAKSGGHGTPLHVASYEGHLDVVRLLLDHGADINSGDNDGKTPLVAAYRGNNLEAMRLLLEHGAEVDVEYDGFGLILHDASYNGQAEVIELLLLHKADVNARGSTKWTPLHWASRAGHAKVILLLLEHGADINAQFGAKDTPLSLASVWGHLDVARVLLEHGADVHIRARNGRTALQLAKAYGHLEVAQILLKYGAETE